ncbi:3-deoxy-manno-octulosonate cytidylyltransferase (CMP-KDO synthetase) [Spirosomataceae bacterium TFI 002]|nr:3-deoxy-manno-octulosonate cytidylyltransferase (CMP-KDO synthetase) [Spirosomataceae bacterium TFI 002]
MKIIGIIPARYGSTRFPGKPLELIDGVSVIQRVYEQCKKATALQEVVVATDDERIYKHVEGFGGLVEMTSTSHESGTDRCAEAVASLNGFEKYDYILNIQGDEPFIRPKLINDLCEVLDFKTEIATSVKKIENIEDLENPNVVKAVLTMRMQALYFSRQAIPYLRDVPKEDWLKRATFYKHIGIYAFRSDILTQIVKLPPNVLEQTERLEQLRWLGYGFRIQAIETKYENIGIDTPQDLDIANRMSNK